MTARLRLPAVAITEAPPRVPATALGQWTSPDLTTVAYAPSPSRLGPDGVATEILGALGKLSTVTGKPRHSSNARNLAALWLTAHRTQSLLALACQRSTPTDLRAVVDMCSATPTNLLFAADHGHLHRLQDVLLPYAPTVIDWPGTPPTNPDGPGSDNGDGTDSPLVWDSDVREVLPAVEYWAFYATARRQMPTDQFAPIHDLYVITQARVRDWLRAHTEAGADITVQGAHRVVTTLLEEQPTFDLVTVVIRATQAALHQAGWLLTVDERELRNGLVRFQPTAALPHLYDRLRAYSEPARAATVALALADSTPAAIRSVTVDDLAQWRSNPTYPVADIEVPDLAAPYLRAALLARANDGARPRDPAFPGDKRRVKLDLRQAAKDLDINIGDANLNETSTLSSRRVPERIVALERIA